MGSKPEWWPKTPYPSSIFPMTTKQYMDSISDPMLRTAISGCMARFGWAIAEKQFNKIFQDLFEDRVDVREVIQCLTDSNALLEDTQRAHEILPDSHSGNRKMICDGAREAYGMGSMPYLADTLKPPPQVRVTQKQLDIMRHTIGIDRKREPYRNYFSADADHADIDNLRELVHMGLMAQGKVSGTPDLMFYVLDSGFWMLGLVATTLKKEPENARNTAG